MSWCHAVSISSIPLHSAVHISMDLVEHHCCWLLDDHHIHLKQYFVWLMETIQSLTVGIQEQPFVWNSGSADSADLQEGAAWLESSGLAAELRPESSALDLAKRPLLQKHLTQV